MNERELLREFARDVQSAADGRRRVLYLEGKTDVPILLALLGARDERDVSNGVLHDGVWSAGLAAAARGPVRWRSGSGVSRQSCGRMWSSTSSTVTAPSR